MQLLRKFRVSHLAFAVLCLYPLIIQLRKVATLDVYLFNITPFSILILFYIALLIGSRTNDLKPQTADIIGITCSFSAFILDTLIWNSKGAAIHFYNQYFFIEILFYFSLITKLPIEMFIRAIYLQSGLSLSFVALEVAMAGGLNFSAIASRQIGIGQGSITGFFDEPALLAYAYSLNSLILLCGIERQVLPKRKALAVTAIMLTVVVLTLTRAGLFNIVLIGASILIYSIRSKFGKTPKRSVLYRRRRSIFIIFIIGSVITAAMFPYLEKRSEATADTIYMSNLLGDHLGLPIPTIPANAIFRIDQTTTALKLIATNPLGIGPLAAKSEQEKSLLFPQFASNGSGNIVTDVFVTFGIPIALIYFIFFFKQSKISSEATRAERYLAATGLIMIIVNTVTATGKLVAVTDSVVVAIMSSPQLYIGTPLFIGPRNIEGLLLTTFIAFISITRVEAIKNSR